jgi:hypothetical protein
MKKGTNHLWILLLFILAGLISHNLYAQLTGVKTIPGDYATITAAVTDLNTAGVGTGGVTFNIAAGYTETAANLTITATGTSANPIVFQKSGAGNNPLITAGTGVSTTLDGIIKLSGTDYITFDRIDLRESTGNTTAETQMEWGYALLKVDAANGSQYITIKNCTITLNKTNVNSRGIYSANHTTASTTTLTITDTLGANSYNKFYSNIISDCNSGIWIGGSSLAAYYDLNNEVGVTGSGQNKIFNYGTTAVAYGVYGIYQNRIKIFNTNINNSGGAAATSTLYGIFLSTGVNSSADIYNDTVTVIGGGTTSQVAGIYNNMGGTGTNNTINIYNNIIQNCTYETATSGAMYYMYHSASCFDLNIYGNKVINNVYGSAATTSTGTIGYLYTLGGTATNNNWQIYNNTISNNTRVQSTLSTGITYGLYNGASGPNLNVYGNLLTDVNMSNTSTNYLFYLASSNAINLNCYDNTVKNITRNSTSGATYCYYLTGGTAGGVHNIYNNTLNNITLTTTGATYCVYSSASVNKNIYQDTIRDISSTGGAVYGLYHTAGVTSNIYRNKFHGLSSGTGVVYGSYILGGTTNYYYNNFVSDIKSTASTSTLGVVGLYISSGTSSAFFNTIYLNAVSSSVTTFGSAGIYASTTPTVDLRNNIVVNVSDPGPTGGFTTAYQRSSSSLGTYSTRSNNNILFAGSPGANRLIFYDGINADQTINDFKTRVSPSDSVSFTENPPFINVSVTPYDLHISTVFPTGVESSGIPVSDPISVTDDYDNNIRNVTTPDIGADEGTFLVGDLQAPGITYTPLGNTGTISNRTLLVEITDNSGVQNTPPNDPRIYYKKGVNGIYKYRNKTSQAGNNYTFTIVIDSVGGMAIGDSMFYYVAAQDIASNPNLSTNPSGGSGTNPPGTVPPGAPNIYTVVASPLTGTYTIPGSFSTIATAMGELTLRGNSGPCTFNVAAGHTETSSNIILETPNPPATRLSQFPVIFQKSGAGANPIITAGVGSGTMDGIIKFNGADNVIIDGIDLRENPSNINSTTQMEWGFALLKASGTDGSQNIIIRNCNITLDKTNLSSVGIYSANHTVNSTTSLPVTDTAGTNSNNKFYSNTISNVNSGIFMTGFASASPYDLYDQNNEVGITGSRQNRIYNYGSTTTAYGIYGIYQNGIKIFNTNINNSGGAPAVSVLYGIYLTTGINSNVDIYNDTVTVVNGGTTSTTYAIFNGMGSTGTSNNINIYNNTITGCSYDNATSGALYHIYQSASCYNMNIYGNNISGNTLGSSSSTATGTLAYIYTFGGNTNSGSVWKIYNNNISNNSRVQSVLGGGTVYTIYTSATGQTYEIYGNTVSNNIWPATTSTRYGIYASTSNPLLVNVYNNTFRNISAPNLSAGTFYAIYLSTTNAANVSNIYNNSISNITSTGATALYGIYATTSATGTRNVYQDTIYDFSSDGGAIYGIYTVAGNVSEMHKNKVYGLVSTTGAVYGIYIAGSTDNLCYNNYVSDLKATASTGTVAVSGLYVSAGTNVYAAYNTIYLNAVSTSVTTFGSAGIWSSTTPVLALRNNIIVNTSVPGPTGGYTAAYQRSSATLTTYMDSSNNNDFYAGTPSANRVIFYDGTNSDSTIAAFKLRVAPRDGNSFTENPPFVNVSATPYDLHIQTSVPTRIEGGAIPITLPIPVTTDYDNQTRNATTPDVGADEGSFTPFVLPPANVNLTVIPGGFYNTGTGRLNMKDTIRVYLVDSVTCQKVDSAIGVIDSLNYSMQLSFMNAETGNYYMLVYHRNHLAVASRYRQNVVRGSTVGYDFTTDSTKAFGFNMVKVSTSPVRWAMISGDANKDGFVDGLDQTLWSGQNGFDGYLSGDFNGDSFVDGLDQTIWIIYNGNGSFLPCGFFLDPVSSRIQLNTSNYDAKRGNMIIFEKTKIESNSKIR